MPLRILSQGTAPQWTRCGTVDYRHTIADDFSTAHHFGNQIPIVAFLIPDGVRSALHRFKRSLQTKSLMFQFV
jgi:hypothetical protein